MHIIVVYVCVSPHEAQSALHSVIDSGFDARCLDVFRIDIAHVVVYAGIYVFVCYLVSETVVVCRQ